MKRLTKVLAVVLTLSMVAAACGGDDEAEEPGYEVVSVSEVGE